MASANVFAKVSKAGAWLDRFYRKSVRFSRFSATSAYPTRVRESDSGPRVISWSAR